MPNPDNAPAAVCRLIPPALCTALDALGAMLG